MPLSLYMFMQLDTITCHTHTHKHTGRIKRHMHTVHVHVYTLLHLTQADISTHKLNVNMIITDKKPIMINAENIISVK